MICVSRGKEQRKGRTIKKRILIPDFQEELDTEKRNFVNEVLGYPANLTPPYGILFQDNPGKRRAKRKINY